MCCLRAFLWLVLVPFGSRGGGDFSKEKVAAYRAKTAAMFYHAYDGYLNHAYPLDELMPLSCKGTDTWGSFSLTLVDSLDTLIILGNHSEFRRAAALVQKSIDFNANVNVSVFETNIRVVGGLLSAHMLSGLAGAELEEGWPCSGPLLRLAQRMADKLLPAFNTATGMPYGTVNLRHGVHLFETPITCTAGVGTYLLEFGALSRLTGNPHYERIALKALRALWKRRSSLNLVGNHINVETGAWTATDAGIGAGVDSYFEYLAKGALLFQRPELMQQFRAYRDAINAEIRQEDWFMWVGMAKGGVSMPVFQSLEAFWPGTLSLIGDIDSAMRILATYRQVLRQYGFTPEFFNIPNLEAVAKRSGYPLRPELIESTLYLYRATKDPQLLHMGAELVEAIEHSTRTPCGYATVHNVKDHTLEDRMESFFLAETTKYLYLLFDPDNFIHNPGAQGDLIDTPDGKCVVNAGGYFFNTEAHPIDPGALYCCSEQRKKDLSLVEDFEQGLDFLSMMGMTDAEGREASPEFQLKKEDLPEEIADLDEPFVPPTGDKAEDKATHIGYRLQNGSEGSVNLETSGKEKEVEEDEEEGEEISEPGNPGRSSSSVVEASTDSQQQPRPLHGGEEKLSVEELLSSHAGSDPKGLRANLSKALGGQGKDSSSELADNLIKAFSSLLNGFQDLVDATDSLKALEQRSLCDETAELCPVDLCRRVDQPTASAGLNRLLNLMYKKERRWRVRPEPFCHQWEAPSEARNYRNATPNLRFFSTPLVRTKGSVSRLAAMDAEPFAELAEQSWALMSCPLPAFLSRFSGLGQVVPMD